MYVLYYCRAEKESLCYFKEARVRIPVRIEKEAGGRNVAIAYELAVR